MPQTGLPVREAVAVADPPRQLQPLVRSPLPDTSAEEPGEEVPFDRWAERVVQMQGGGGEAKGKARLQRS